MLKEFYKKQNTVEHKAVPYGFSNRVMNSIREKNSPRRTYSLQLSFAGAAVLAILVLILWSPFTSRPKLLPGEAYTIITYLGSSKDSVAVLGDFNSWRPQRMNYSNGKWQVKLKVKKNQMYQYHFKVNGKQVADKHNPVKSSGYFGGQNSVLIVMNGSH